MRSSQSVDEIYLAELIERLIASAEVATVLGSILASTDTVESEGRQMKLCWKKLQKIGKIPPLKK
jgi:hypothetical protein